MVELTEKFQSEHQKQKKTLMDKGVTFYDIGSQFSEDIVGGQRFRGAEYVEEAHSYEELNYIKTGLTTGWVTRLEDIERYQEIENIVSSIVDQLKVR